MIKIKKLFQILLSLTLFVALPTDLQAATVNITGSIIPLDATSFVSTNIGGGSGECALTWTTSVTPNIDTQRIEISGPQGPGISFTTKDLTPFPGSSIPDNYNLYAPNTNVQNLVIGWPYIFKHVSIAGSLESPGVWASCTPTSVLPAPVMTTEPATTEGSSNTVYWTNGGIDDATLECNVQASITDLNIDPLSFDYESGWGLCPTSGTTYQHTFSSLALDTTYFYHVQSRTPADGLSPFSNVVFSKQIAGGEPPPDDDGGGGGRRPPRPDSVCGNGILESGEQCDDGNTISGDGCSATCDIEHPAAQECGNGILEEGEECDDGNTINGDGCDSACQIEEEEIEEIEEIVTVRFEIKGAPEFRVPHATDPNLSLNSQFLVYKPAISSLDNVQIKLDDFGNAIYEGEIVIGNYDFGLNGEAHNTKIIRGIEITPATEVVVLDFTLAETFKLTAGDTVDNNYINGVDMSKLIQQYRVQGTEVLSDLNKEGYVNGIDASIVITNYRKAGEDF